jgi:hypothetical protein
LVEAAVVPSRPGAEEWASPRLQFPPALRWQLEVGSALPEVEFEGSALRHLGLTAPFERVAPVLEYSAVAAEFPNFLVFAA